MRINDRRRLQCLRIGIILLVGCGGAKETVRMDGQIQAEFEPVLIAQYPIVSHVSAVGCSDQGLDHARQIGRDEVLRQVNLRMESELTRIVREQQSDKDNSWLDEIVVKTRQTSSFEDAELILSDSRVDVRTQGEWACVVMHLSRDDADARLGDRWRGALARFKAAANRCEAAFPSGDGEAFTPAMHEMIKATPDLLRLHRDRRGIGRGDANEFNQAILLRERVLDMAGRLRGGAVFAVDVAAPSPDQEHNVSQQVVTSFQKLGLRAIPAGSDGVRGANYIAHVFVDEQCDSSNVGQLCRVQLSLQGGRVGQTGQPLQVSVELEEPAIHRSSRDSAAAEAYRMLLASPALEKGLKEGLARILPF
jgi:hypothetical protein